jgi:hypothetical protein
MDAAKTDSYALRARCGHISFQGLNGYECIASSFRGLRRGSQEGTLALLRFPDRSRLGL